MWMSIVKSRSQTFEKEWCSLCMHGLINCSYHAVELLHSSSHAVSRTVIIIPFPPVTLVGNLSSPILKLWLPYYIFVKQQYTLKPPNKLKDTLKTGHLSLVERLSSSRKFSFKPIGKSSCLLFGGSIIRGFTVLHYEQAHVHSSCICHITLVLLLGLKNCHWIDRWEDGQTNWQTVNLLNCTLCICVQCNNNTAIGTTWTITALNSHILRMAAVIRAKYTG